jgi:hypothetical protein
MQAIEDIISYFSPVILIVTLKRAQNSNWGKIYDFFSPCVFMFSPLGYAIIVLLSQTVYWGKNMARGKSNHTMFHKIMGNLEKSASNRGHTVVSYFFPYYFNCLTKKSTKIQQGKIYDIFSPCVFIISPLGNAIIVLLSQTVYWGENMARGKSNHKIIGSLEKNAGNRGHNIIF